MPISTRKISELTLSDLPSLAQDIQKESCQISVGGMTTSRNTYEVLKLTGMQNPPTGQTNIFSINNNAVTINKTSRFIIAIEINHAKGNESSSSYSNLNLFLGHGGNETRISASSVYNKQWQTVSLTKIVDIQSGDYIYATTKGRVDSEIFNSFIILEV